jgi:hypothetical protein
MDKKYVLYFIVGLLIFGVIISNLSRNSTSTIVNSETTPATTQTHSKFINGKVGRYTYSYAYQQGMVAVLFDGKGMYVGNSNIGFESALILTALAKMYWFSVKWNFGLIK